MKRKNYSDKIAYSDVEKRVVIVVENKIVLFGIRWISNLVFKYHVAIEFLCFSIDMGIGPRIY